MTTHTEVTGSSQIVGTRLAEKKINWFWVMDIALALVLIITAFVVALPANRSVESSQRALEAMSARYQGVADIHAARNEASAQRALEAMSARYQGLADLQIAQRSLKAVSARYQGLADLHVARSAPALEAMSARYQGLAELHGAGQLEQYWSSVAGRYQAMAEVYLQDKGIEAGRSASAARYQVLAEHFRAQ